MEPNRSRDTTQSSQREGQGREEQTSDFASKSHEAVESVKSAALERVEAARESADSARREAAERVRKLSSTLRRVGDHLRVEEQNAVANYAANASQQIESVASYVESASLRSVVQDAEDLARRRPGLFFGSTFMVGMAAGRILKMVSTGDERRAQRRVQRAGEFPAIEPESRRPPGAAPRTSASATSSQDVGRERAPGMPGMAGTTGSTGSTTTRTRTSGSHSSGAGE